MVSRLRRRACSQGRDRANSEQQFSISVGCVETEGNWSIVADIHASTISSFAIYRFKHSWVEWIWGCSLNSEPPHSLASQHALWNWRGGPGCPWKWCSILGPLQELSPARGREIKGRGSVECHSVGLHLGWGWKLTRSLQLSQARGGTDCFLVGEDQMK